MPKHNGHYWYVYKDGKRVIEAPVFESSVKAMDWIDRGKDDRNEERS